MTSTPRISRVLVAALASTLAAAGLGCGILDQAKNLVDTASVLSDFADRLGKAANLTYTAEYTVTGGDNVTLVQQPPNAAFISESGRFIFTSDTLYLCGVEGGAMTCQKSANQASDVNAADAGFVAGVAGPGFVTPELALGLVAASALVPGAKVSESTKTIAGQQSLCADVTGVDAADTSGDESLKDFSVCVTEVGILASFRGTSTEGQTLGVELVKYTSSADPAAFAPPTGAKIVEVDQIQPS